MVITIWGIFSENFANIQEPHLCNIGNTAKGLRILPYKARLHKKLPMYEMIFQTLFSIAQISEKVNANVLIAGYKEKLEMEGILQSDPFLILVT